MKKIIIALFSLLAMFQLSCNPIEEEHKQGSVIAESELKLDVYPLTEGGNKIVMINNTPMVGSHWNYGSGISVRQQDTVLVPFLGEKEIVFTGICAGGTISTTRKVTIDNILYPIEDEWAIFAGTDKNGKDWMWDYTSPEMAAIPEIPLRPGQRSRREIWMIKIRKSGKTALCIST